MSELYWVGVDGHWPKTDKKTLDVSLKFIESIKPKGVILAGDQFDNEELSHHNRNKPFYKERRAYQKNEQSFDEQFLKPLEQAAGKKAEKTWIIGNHDDWEFQFVEEHPELEGVIDRVSSLRLKERGWEIIPRGYSKELGELSVIHGEVLTGIGNQGGKYPANKALDIYGGNVLAGHTHSPQSMAKISPVEQRKKYMAWISPILGAVNPTYLKNRPTAWMNGFTLVEVMDNGYFNCYPIIIFNGRFSFAGKEYKA